MDDWQRSVESDPSVVPLNPVALNDGSAAPLLSHTAGGGAGGGGGGGGAGGGGVDDEGEEKGEGEVKRGGGETKRAGTKRGGSMPGKAGKTGKTNKAGKTGKARGGETQETYNVRQDVEPDVAFTYMSRLTRPGDDELRLW